VYPAEPPKRGGDSISENFRPLMYISTAMNYAMNGYALDQARLDLERPNLV